MKSMMKSLFSMKNSKELFSLTYTRPIFELDHMETSLQVITIGELSCDTGNWYIVGTQDKTFYANNELQTKVIPGMIHSLSKVIVNDMPVYYHPDNKPLFDIVYRS